MYAGTADPIFKYQNAGKSTGSMRNIQLTLIQTLDIIAVFICVYICLLLFHEVSQIKSLIFGLIGYVLKVD